MSVYVDEPIYRYGNMHMCHMIADTQEELLAMADHIGVQRKWLQRKPVVHFDISKSKRALAVKAGAKEADRMLIVAVMSKLKAQSQ